MNPLTAAGSFQPLVETGIIEAKRGIGMVIARGGIERFRESERISFAKEEWPLITARSALLLSEEDLLSAGKRSAKRQLKRGKGPAGGSCMCSERGLYFSR